MGRGTSGLSFVVGVDKPGGITSHDVVNRCRRIFGERRVGHTGTLDPMASGAMAVCVGPATKLSNYLTFHDKEYLARIVFGAATDTDDAQGAVVRTCPVPERLADEGEARRLLAGLCGRHEQLPPAYSAKKVGGVRAYEAARAGADVALAPQEVEIARADLIAVGRDQRGALFWDARFAVSAGTYIRAIARDLGAGLGTCAHLGALRRLRSGRLPVGSCVTLEALEADPLAGRLDPVALLGIRAALPAGARAAKAAANGAPLWPGDLRLFELPAKMEQPAGGAGAPGCTPSARPPAAGELVGVVDGGKLEAIYEYDGASGRMRARCVFAQGVDCGTVQG